MKPSRSITLELRGTHHHVREWGAEDAPRIFMLHGYADVSATFQFVVDALRREWHVIAPDWRGFGGSARGADAYWHPDYCADLDALLRHYSPNDPANLVGHSMGGNIASIYAGVKPERVANLVAMEAFGLPDTPPEEAPKRIRQWLEQLESPPGFRSHPDVSAFAARLMRANQRLTRERADFLATCLAEPDGANGVRIAAETAHRNVNPVLYRRAEAEHCWRRITARVLWIVQEDATWRRSRGFTDDMYDAARRCFSDLRERSIVDSGHNLHHDQPEKVAATIEAFLLSELNE